MRNSAIIALSLALTACAKPHLPDPRFEFPAPPERLMQPEQPLQTIQPSTAPATDAKAKTFSTDDLPVAPEK
jgi:hypothetical protein